MRVLFIGRFQPFHMGHLSVIQKALADNEHVTIAIGSAEANYRPKNPFTCGERLQMIEAAMRDLNIPRERWSIYAVPNIRNYGLWAQHVETWLPPFFKIFTGSDVVKKLFEDYNKKLANPYEILPIKKELNISSTDIRERMLRKRKWEYLVPESVAKLIHEWGGPERLLSIQEIQK